MGRVAAVRFMGLYVPVVAAFLLAFLGPQRERIFPAALFGFVWTLPSLLAVQLLNLHFGWWQFNAQGGLLRGIPNPSRALPRMGSALRKPSNPVLAEHWNNLGG